MNTRFLEGKITLLSGAYRNLGEVTAMELAGKGSDIVLNDLPGAVTPGEKDTLLERIRKKNVRAVAVDGDISSLKAVRQIRRKIVEELGQVSIIINCAGPFNLSPFLKLKEKDWNTVMDVNVKAVYVTAGVFAPDMKSAGWGRIVNLSAGSSFVRNHGVFGLAKAAVSFLTEELSLELGPEITVNAVAPGQIEESLPLVHKIDPSFGERYTERAPLKRLVRRRDVARLIAMLCSPVSDMITGETIRIDGGAELPRF